MRSCMYFSTLSYISLFFWKILNTKTLHSKTFRLNNDEITVDDVLFSNLESCKCARMTFHCANALVALRICPVAHLRGNTDSGYNFLYCSSHIQTSGAFSVFANILWINKTIFNQSQFNFVMLALCSFRKECHEWPAVFISACLRRGPHGYFRSECLIDGELMQWRIQPVRLVGGVLNSIWQSSLITASLLYKRWSILHNTHVTKQWTTQWPYIANAIFRII